jgi:thioredoxin-like negative regulator of GroEL
VWAVSAAVSVAVVSVLALGLAWAYAAGRPARLRARAEAASRAGDWPAALAAWRAVNAGGPARARTLLAEARAALALGRADEAERALARACLADPSDPEPWRLRLELLRVEDRVTDARRVGWEAYAAVAPPGRRGVLRDLTLALLADLPDDTARATLARWAAAGAETAGDPSDPDPDTAPDPDARAALLQRFNTMPRAGDPPRAERVAELSAILGRRPGHLGAREALVTALADAGETEAGRRALDAWPESGRDARYWRLRGRWDLEFDRHPDRAVDDFTRALEELPHDWKTRFRLARALRASGRAAEASREAESVGRLREALDPAALGPRLDDDFRHLDDPRALRDLASLCGRAGLSRLADAWRAEAASVSRP